MIGRVETGIVDFTRVNIDYDKVVLHIFGDNRKIINNKFKNIAILNYSIRENFEHLVKDIKTKTLENLCFHECVIFKNIRDLIKTFNKNFYADNCTIYKNKEDEDFYLKSEKISEKDAKKFYTKF